MTGFEQHATCTTSDSLITNSGIEIVQNRSTIWDLAPMIVRQRLVIEGTCLNPITEHQVKDYLQKLTEVCGMISLAEPVTHLSRRHGWAGWIHWEDSGAHFYAWDTPKLFFSADIYTCKAFDPGSACEFTKEYFQAPRIAAMAF